MLSNKTLHTLHGAGRSATGRLGARRQLHLDRMGGADLLTKHLPEGTRISVAGPGQGIWGVPIKLVACRKRNVPVLEGTTRDGRSHVLDLDILQRGLPSGTDAWLAQVGVSKADRPEAAKHIQGLWTAWRDNGLLRVTGNLHSWLKPEMTGVHVVADDFALKTHPGIQQLGDADLVHPLERVAAEGSLFYHKNRNGGNIACYGYGAGIAMSTNDALVAAGGMPANFLDGGGGATEANVRAAMGLILSDPDAKVLFINSFGGITKMDLLARGMVECITRWKQEGHKVPPVIARLRGTGEDEARQILEEAAIPEIKCFADLKPAAEEAVRLAGGKGPGPTKAAPVHTVSATPVTFSLQGQYEKTLRNLVVKENDPVMVVGMGKASQSHSAIAQDWGTNIIGAVAPNKGGQTFLSKPTYGSVKEGVDMLNPRIASVFVPPAAAADSIIECIEAQVPLIVSYAEGVPTHDQLRVQAALRSQGTSRLVGANCPGVIFPHQRVKLGIQPLRVHSPGSVGIACRSGTISYELAAQTTALGLGQSAVYGLGGDPFPGTRTWEALQLMLEDPACKLVVLVGEVGGQMEEEAADVYRSYLASVRPGQTAKPVIGFVAGASTQRGLVYGHAGAVWWNPEETAEAKRQVWKDAGFVVADTLGDLGPLISEEAAKLRL